MTVSVKIVLGSILGISILVGNTGILEESAEVVISAFNGTATVNHITPYLQQIATHGHSLPDHQKDILRNLGFDFSKKLVTRTLNAVRDESDGLDRTLDTENFRIHYTLTGKHAVNETDTDGNDIPDYIDRIADVFNTVYIQIIQQMGYTPPPSDNWYPSSEDNGGSGHYDIYVHELLFNDWYGYTSSEFLAQNTGDNEFSAKKENNAVTSYLAIRNNYDGFPNTLLENIQVTAVHEFFHAIQFGYDFREKPWMMEASAVWMEDKVYDDVNDCYQYMASWFASPEISLNQATDHWYGSFIFFQYIDEHLGGGTAVRHVWESSVDYNSEFGDFSIQAFDDGLQPGGSSFKDALNKMVIANRIMSSDPHAGIYSYEEAEDYPVTGPRIQEIVDYSANTPMTILSSNLQVYASQYIQLNSQTPVKAELFNTSGGPEEDLELHAIIQTLEGDYLIRSGSPVNVDPTRGINWAYLAVVSQEAIGSDWDYRIEFNDGVPDPDLIDLPEDFTLSRPWPNPFPNPSNASLRFDLMVTQPQSFTINIYDLYGHTVQTLYKGSLQKRSHTFTWNGRTRTGRLAPSGLYFIVAEGKRKQVWKKVTYIK